MQVENVNSSYTPPPAPEQNAPAPAPVEEVPVSEPPVEAPAANVDIIA